MLAWFEPMARWHSLVAVQQLGPQPILIGDQIIKVTFIMPVARSYRFGPSV